MRERERESDRERWVHRPYNLLVSKGVKRTRVSHCDVGECGWWEKEKEGSEPNVGWGPQEWDMVGDREDGWGPLIRVKEIMKSDLD